MRILVTGASGFLGQPTVAALIARGHRVIALVRPSSTDPFRKAKDVEVRFADLRSAIDTRECVRDVDAVVHLAACVVGDEAAQFANTVLGTEHLIAAMAGENIRRCVHVSSLSVYDWHQCGPILDESTPLESDIYARDGYAITKLWQERLMRRAAVANGWELSVLRPGFLWGRDHLELSGTGHDLGRFHLMIGGRRRLPLAYVENCADAIGHVLGEIPRSCNTFNVMDGDSISVRHYLSAIQPHLSTKRFRIPIPYWMGITNASLATWMSRILFSGRGKLPGMLVPIRFRSRFRPIEFNTSSLTEQTGWKPPYDFGTALARSTVASQPVSDTLPTPREQTAGTTEEFASA